MKRWRIGVDGEPFESERGPWVSASDAADLERDAMRYHWLFRQSVNSGIAVYRINDTQLGEDQFELLNGVEMEAAIDREMEKKA